MKISIIVTTYNYLPALQAVIRSLLEQTYTGNMEIIVADDGSGEETGDWLRAQKTSIPLLHVWHPDQGFQAAKIRNRAAAKASGDYLIFMDGDCVASSSFIQRHAELAEPNCFITGNRIFLSPEFTQQVFNQHLSIHTWKYRHWFLASLQKKCNRALPFFPLLRYLLPKQISNKWQGAKTCNMAMWRKDFIAVNGFDEQYQGWGYEDSDLAVRLLRLNRSSAVSKNNGVQRYYSRFCIPVIHLWHPESDRSQEEKNRLAFEKRLESEEIIVTAGVGQYLDMLNSD